MAAEDDTRSLSFSYSSASNRDWSCSTRLSSSVPADLNDAEDPGRDADWPVARLRESSTFEKGEEVESREVDVCICEIFGEGGGGIDTALGTRARGVFMDGRLRGREGEDGVAPPILVSRPVSAFGVVKGEPDGRVGEDKVRDIEGLDKPELGPPVLFRVGLSAPVPRPRELSCCAVIVIYFDARDPAVILSDREESFAFATGVLRTRFPTK